MSNNTVQIVINADGKQATAELKTVGAELKGLGASAATAGSSAASAWRSFVPGAFVLGTISGVALGMNELIQSTVQLGMRLETLSLSYKAVTGTSYAAGQELEFVRATANRLGADFQTLAQGYKTIAAAAMNTTLEGQQTRQIFTAVSQAAAALGLTADDTKGILLALGQMISKGTVQAEELRQQLGERLPGAFQLAAKAMGVSTAELDKMLQKGEVVATDFLPKLAQAMSDQYKGSAADAANTFRGKLNLLGNELVTLAQNVWNGGMEAAFSKLIGGLTAATSAINTFNAAKYDKGAPGTSPMGLGAFYEPESSTRWHDTSTAIEQNIVNQRKAESNIRADEALKKQAAEQEKLNNARSVAVKVDTAATKALFSYTQQWQALETVRGEIGEENYWRKLSAATEDYNKAITGHTKAVGGAASAQKDWDRVLQEGENIRKSVLTDYEKYQEEMERLKFYLNSGAVSWETYTRAVEKAGSAIGMAADKQAEFKRMAIAAKSYEDMYGKSVVEPAGMQAGMDAGIKTGGFFNEAASNTWKEHQKDLKDTGKEYDDLKRTIEGFGKDSAGALADFMMGTKGNFGDMIKSMARELLQMTIYEGFMKKLFGSVSENSGSWLSGLFSAAGTVAGGASGVSAEPRASGGSVSDGGWYLVGENGPELLRAGGRGEVIPSGRATSSGPKVKTTINVNVAHNGSANDPAATRDMADQVGAAVKAKFAECLQEHMRPGGMLNRSGYART